MFPESSDPELVASSSDVAESSLELEWFGDPWPESELVFDNGEICSFLCSTAAASSKVLLVAAIVGLILFSSDWLFAPCVWSTPQTSTSILSSVWWFSFLIGLQQLSVLISVIDAVCGTGTLGAVATGLTGAVVLADVLPSLSWISLCCFNVKDLLNVLWQISHSNALTFVCVFWCDFRFEIWQNARPQMLHLYGFSPINYFVMICLFFEFFFRNSEKLNSVCSVT